MVDAVLFDKLEAVAKDIRRNTRAFGGIQLVLTGDFYQLPPVDSAPKFAFEANSWNRVVTKQIELKKVFRQTDMTFVKLLNELRTGHCTDETRRVLKSLERVPNYPNDGIEPTHLYSRRQEVDNANTQKLANLPGEVRKYTATDTGTPENVKKLDSSCMAPQVLYLKVNAQVVLIKSLDTALGAPGLVNGSRGVVVSFSPKTGLPIVRFTNGKEIEIEKAEFSQESSGEKLATRRQVPLLLAW